MGCLSEALPAGFRGFFSFPIITETTAATPSPGPTYKLMLLQLSGGLSVGLWGWSAAVVKHTEICVAIKKYIMHLLWKTVMPLISSVVKSYLKKKKGKK